MFAPRTTPAGAPPTRSAIAERAAETIASARPDAGKTPPRSETGMRMAWATARATFSGSSAPAGPSVWTKPSASAGNSPRTRATSRRPSPTQGTLVRAGVAATGRSAGCGAPGMDGGGTGQDGGHDGTGKRQRAGPADRRRRPRRPARRHDAHARGGRRRSGRRARRDRHGRGAGQGHADRHDDQAAARGGARGAARRCQPQPAARHPRRLHPRAGGGPLARPARGAGADHAALQRGRDPLRCRAAHRAGAAGRLAGGRLPRDPDGAVRPADGRPRAAGGDAPPGAAGRSAGAAAARLPTRGRAVPLRPGARGNGTGTAGFVCGSAGLVLAGLIPLLGVVLGVLGVSLGGVGLSRARARGSGRGLSVAGVVLGALALVAAVVFWAVYARLLSRG